MNQEKLKQLLDYDPEIGVFTWVHRSNGRVPAGAVAGTRNHHKGYIYIKIGGKQYAAHRLAWLYMVGEWPEFEIDHHNHVKDDNRIKNLRPATHFENAHNQPMRKSNKSGVTGVCFHSRDGVWSAKITINYHQLSLGYFPGWFDAVCARKSANNKYGFHKNHGKNHEIESESLSLIT